jgi:ABC-type multidrug transport system ATPase subunit
MIGYCSQFDTLWDELTGFEHLVLMSKIKGVTVDHSLLEKF